MVVVRRESVEIMTIGMTKPSEDCPEVFIFTGLWDVAFPAAEQMLGFKPLTKKQLGEAGYQTGKALPCPCAALMYSKSDTGYLYVYNPADATPKRKPSEAQKAALAKAQEATRRRYICDRCECHLQRHEYGQSVCDRCEMIVWAQQVLDEGAYILDTETTGLNSTDEICQLAIIDTSGHVHFNSLIHCRNPEVMYKTGSRGLSAHDIHGIHAEDLKQAPHFEDVHFQLSRILKDRDTVIYNWHFDADKLEAMCERRGLPPIQLEGYCAMLHYSQYVGDIRYDYGSRRRRYSDWSYRWQSLPGGNHLALGDCFATLAVIKKMAGESVGGND